MSTREALTGKRPYRSPIYASEALKIMAETVNWNQFYFPNFLI